MEFSRIGTHTIRCVITEEEISDLGYTIEDILGNAEKTQEFMNEIFDIAEQELGMKFDMGLKTVRADFLPNHSVSLTFSENASQKKMNGFVEHLLEYVNEMLGLSKEKLDEIKEQAGIESEKEKEQSKEKVRIAIMLQFTDMDTLCTYARNINLERIPESTLFKFEDIYYLMMNLSSYSEDEVLRLSVLTDEYATGLMVGNDRLAFLKEHADVILESRAIETLREI
ncbi:MAG: adaptor protein MecA [Lachnospiraceae bacterium]|jgi:adapter protein MecA 1/2|nr:adaptor protein MecA [Lachnospiraceae bacterium]